MTNFLIYPTIDNAYAFPTEVRQKIADSPELKATIASTLQDWKRSLMVATKYAPRALRANVAVASGITVTNPAATTFSGATMVKYDDARLVTTGGSLVPFANPAYGVAKLMGSDASANPASVGVNFTFEGQAFEWESLGNDGLWRVWVNGKPHAAYTAWAVQTPNSYFKVDLGSRAVWDIRIEHFRGYFAGVWVQSTDKLTAPRPGVLSPLRMVIIGDSFANGQTWTGGLAPTGSVKFTPGYAPRLQELLQVEDIRVPAIGGTGFINKGSGGTHPTFRERLALDVIPYRPDVLVFQGTVNDEGQTDAAITAAVNAAYAEARAGLPNTLIIGTSLLTTTDPGTNRRAKSAVLKAAWKALGVPYVDMIDFGTGTGNEAAPTGSGTSDVNTSGDGTHPSWPAGFDALAQALAPKIAPLLDASSLG